MAAVAVAAVGLDALKYLDAIEATKRREITRFVDAHRHVKGVTEITQMQWVADAMELMAQTRLSNPQKHDLVIALYKDMAKDDTNDYKEDFDAGSAIEFIWDATKNRFGVVIRRKGCLTSCLPACCSDVSVIDDNGQIKVGFNPAANPPLSQDKAVADPASTPADSQPAPTQPASQ